VCCTRPTKCFQAPPKNYEKRLLASSCLSVRPHGKTRLTLDGLWTNLILSIYQKSAEKIQVTLKYDKNDSYFTWWPINIFKNLILSIYQKSAEKIQVTLKSDKNDRYFTWWPINILKNLILSIYQKSAEKIQVTLKSDKNDSYFTWWPINIFKRSLSILLRMKIFLRQTCKENQNVFYV
jgi:hypothetical protein